MGARRIIKKMRSNNETRRKTIKKNSNLSVNIDKGGNNARNFPAKPSSGHKS